VRFKVTYVGDEVEYYDSIEELKNALSRTEKVVLDIEFKDRHGIEWICSYIFGTGFTIEPKNRKLEVIEVIPSLNLALKVIEGLVRKR